MSFSGGCSCGAVRFTIAAEPVRGFQCQCRDCQKDTGGGHSSVFVFRRDAVDISGEVREISRTSDGGATKRKGFCGNCGVPIYNKPDEKPEFIGIYVGCLDDATAFKDRKSTRLNSSHMSISYAVFCLKKKKQMVGQIASTPPLEPMMHVD